MRRIPSLLHSSCSFRYDIIHIPRIRFNGDLVRTKVALEPKLVNWGRVVHPNLGTKLDVNSWPVIGQSWILSKDEALAIQY